MKNGGGELPFITASPLMQISPVRLRGREAPVEGSTIFIRAFLITPPHEPALNLNGFLAYPKHIDNTKASVMP